MKKTFILVIILLAIILPLVFVKASMLIPVDDNAKEHAQAPGNSPVISDNWELERVDFIHYAKPPASGASKQPTCYKLMGVKWVDAPVNYTINPSNLQGLSEEFITSAMVISAETWDSATSTELFSNMTSINYTVQHGIQDFKNAIVFGYYPDNNAIAVTSVWFTRIGKKIVEFDQIYNIYYTWGDASSSTGVMDLQNIATHELGHAVGLSDIYSSSCSAVTMFGYSDYNEVSKRTLEEADIKGLQKMYGA